MRVLVNICWSYNNKRVKRKLYQDQFGYYIRHNGYFTNVHQKENGEWETSGQGMTLSVFNYRNANHSEANLVKEGETNNGKD